MEISRPDASPSDQLNRQRIRSRARRQSLTGLHAALAVLLFLVLMILLNVLAARHPLRVDVSRAQFYALSGKTHALLDHLEGPVHATVFIQPGHEVYHALYDDTLNLLAEFAYASGGQFTVEAVDPDRYPGRAEAIMTRFELDRANVVLFEQGERFEIVNAEAIMEMDYLPVAQGGLPRPVAFHGEQVFSSALFALTQSRIPKVYFTQGHGERDFDDHDPYVGLSRIGREIRRDQIELASLDFADRSTLPDDIDALIVAGPTRAYAAAEIERIATYANRAGSLILMLSADTSAGFSDTLVAWGIRGEDNVLVDPVRTVSGYDVVISSYIEHPITRHLMDLNCIFYWPRALPLLAHEDDIPPVDKPRATALAVSSSRAWADYDLDQRPYQYDAGRDLKGKMPVAVAVERGAGTSTEMSVSKSRIIVFGDVDFIANSGISGANSDFFMQALNWVLEREQLLEIAPKPVEEVRLIISRKHLDRLFWSVVFGLPGLTALAGLLVWWRRRS